MAGEIRLKLEILIASDQDGEASGFGGSEQRAILQASAPNEDMIREHAKQGGFPADRMSEIKTTIDPTTAE